MSEFDKEAERKRLREKYEEDAKEREATQKMSELLLQGATMTNKHCDTCGSPYFRYQGAEFCPECEGVEGAQTPEQSASEATDIEVTTPADQSAGGDPRQTPDAEAVPETQRQVSTSSGGSQPAPSSTREQLLVTIETLAERARNTQDPQTSKRWLEAAKAAAETLASLE